MENKFTPLEKAIVDYMGIRMGCYQNFSRIVVPTYTQIRDSGFVFGVLSKMDEDGRELNLRRAIESLVQRGILCDEKSLGGFTYIGDAEVRVGNSTKMFK